MGNSKPCEPIMALVYFFVKTHVIVSVVRVLATLKALLLRVARYSSASAFFF